MRNLITTLGIIGLVATLGGMGLFMCNTHYGAAVTLMCMGSLLLPIYYTMEDKQTEAERAEVMRRNTYK
jgi:hypothetical protein